MALAAGLFKQIAYKKEVTYGLIPAAATAQALRRNSSVVNLAKDTYLSAEIKSSFQKSDFRHGVRRGKGKIQGDLMCKTWADFFGFALKRDFAAITAITAAGITIGGSGPSWTVTRAAGSWLTDGIKVGQVIRLSVGAFNALNLSKNILVTDVVSATVLNGMTLNGTALFAEGPISGSTVTVIGKTTFIPQTGHTDNSFSYEHWSPEVTASEVYSGLKVDQINLQLPPTGIAQFDMDVLGQNVTTASAQYFTSPTAQTTTGAMAAVNGVLRVGGVTYAIVTGLSMSINPGFTGDPVVGANTIPNLFPGGINVSGQFTAYFQDAVLRDAFLNETEIDLIVALTADNTAASDFMAIHLPRIKVGSADKTDGEGGIVQTFSFQALEALTGGAGIKTEKTTIQIQDAQA
jgi:hypothetical protein